MEVPVAHSPSARKRVKQNRARRLRNKAAKSALKTQTKKFVAAIGSGDLDAARAGMGALQKRLSQVASKGIIHKNKSRRMISRMAKRLNRATADKAP